MSWRTVLIQNRCSLSLKNAQLRCERNDGVVTIPVEDITVLILETAQAMVTTSLLAALQDHNVAVITCDGRHMPNGLLLPFLPHSRLSEIAALQRDWSRPFRKRCWQRIVQAKIGNQADCLMLTGQDTGTALRADGAAGRQWGYQKSRGAGGAGLLEAAYAAGICPRSGGFCQCGAELWIYGGAGRSGAVSGKLWPAALFWPAS